MIKEINKERKAAGLKAITLNTKLNRTAQAKAKDMFNYEYFDHYSPRLKMFYNQYQNAKIKYNCGGENIALNNCEDVNFVMERWMSSKSHKKNILYKKYTKVGIGKVGPYWVQQFAG